MPTSTSIDTATKLLQVSHPMGPGQQSLTPRQPREHRTGKPVAAPIVPRRRDRPGPRIAQPAQRGRKVDGVDPCAGGDALGLGLMPENAA